MYLDFEELICDHTRNTQEINAQALSLREQRGLILQLLYAIDSLDYQTSLAAVVDNLHKGFCIVINPTSFIYKSTAAIIEKREALDASVKPLLANWRFERLGICTRLILRIALWELQSTTTSPTIIINEAIELAKTFAEKDAYKFINGILDEFLKQNTQIAL